MTTASKLLMRTMNDAMMGDGLRRDCPVGFLVCSRSNVVCKFQYLFEKGNRNIVEVVENVAFYLKDLESVAGLIILLYVMVRCESLRQRC